MEFVVLVRRKRLGAVALIAALAGCMGLRQGSGETVLPEVTSTPPAAESDALRDRIPMLFVSSDGANAILGFPATAKGNVRPQVEIAGDKTGLDQPVALAVDPTSGRIYAANDSSNDVLIFPKGANGNVAPQTLGGSKVPIQGTEGIAIDSSGKIYVSDYKANAIYVFAAGASGNMAPIRTISGSKTRLLEPVGMSFDSKDDLYVSNPYNFDLPIEEFAKGADGNVAPIAVIRGKHTKINHQFGNVSIDRKNRIVVAFTDSILIFAPGAHGNVKPVAVIKGKATGISDVYSVGTDADSNIYATDLNFKKGKSSIRVFSPKARGNMAPIRILTGSRTDLETPHYPSFY
jgi:hypothetical protein